MSRQASGRLPFIDFARGIVMVLMAWDHVSGFWNPGHRGGEGLQGNFPVFTDFTQFVLRVITHVCAPTFMFLAGTALALSVNKRLSRGDSQREVSLHLVKRGGVLLLLASFIVGPAFGNGPFYFGVLACFGASFIIWGLFRRLPTPLILATSLAIILGHPFLNLNPLPVEGIRHIVRLVIHEPNLDSWPMIGLYPIIPWIGVIGLGWCFGVFLLRYDGKRLRKLTAPLAATGAASMVLFAMVRWANGYGNLVLRDGDTLQDWLSVSKYPPDLAFLLFTLGSMCFFLSLGLLLQGRVGFDWGLTGVINTFGRNALFFYLVHLWLYRLRPAFMTRPLFYLDLAGLIILWVAGLVVLWRFCIRYERFKRSHPESLLQYI